MSKNNRKIKIEFKCPEECHLCPIGNYIQSNFYDNELGDADCKFCISKESDNL